MTGDKSSNSRGRVEELVLGRSFTFNGCTINRAVIEIDHINFGLNKKTRRLNDKARTDFSVAEIEEFLMRLDGEFIMASQRQGTVSHFAVRIDCPIEGRFLGREFVMVFNVDSMRSDEICVITVYPGW